MNNVLINACGIKSLGGINVLLTSIQKIKKYAKIELLVSEENLKNKLSLVNDENIVITKTPRFTHPFLPFFLNKDLKKWINSFDTIIHFGNFGFKSKTKDIVFVQNILPYSDKKISFRNIILRYLINRSIKFSFNTIVQNQHVIDYLPSKFKSKIRNIGYLSLCKITKSNGRGIVSISNNLKYKNLDFVEKVFNELIMNSDSDFNLTLILDEERKLNNPAITLKSNINSYQVEKELGNHSIYFHASSLETLCLPLFEAQKSGLLIVAPNLDYARNASFEKKYLYNHLDLHEAIRCIKNAITDLDNLESIEINTYDENWENVLK